MKKFFPKLIFFGFDILAVVVTFNVIREIFKGFSIANLFTAALALWFIPGIALIISAIFNFAHSFNDYDGFGSFMGALMLAPLSLVSNLFQHFLDVMAALFGKERQRSSSSYSQYSSEDRSPSGSKPLASESKLSYLIQSDLRAYGCHDDSISQCTLYVGSVVVHSGGNGTLRVEVDLDTDENGMDSIDEIRDVFLDVIYDTVSTAKSEYSGPMIDKINRVQLVLHPRRR